MSKVNTKKLNPGWFALIVFLALADFGLLIRYFLHNKNVALFNPQGLIAHQQHNLMMYVAAVLLSIGIPTLCLLYFTAWKYRQSNPNAAYDPNKRHGKLFNFSAWVIPALVMLILASVMWPATHKLEPRKTIASSAKPLTIQVVSMRWKWLFLYPQQNIATVNFVQIPINTPVTFELTADEMPMSSFWIPNLGGQLYSMTGHVNRLNLMAETRGDYPGSSAEINGAGFSGMKFTARASSTEDFEDWVQAAKQSTDTLDAERYNSLLLPSQNNPVALYSSYQNDLYNNVVTKYTGPSETHMH